MMENSAQIIGGLLTALFTALGIAVGLRLSRRPPKVVVRAPAPPAPPPFVRDEDQLELLRITPREIEILELIAAGLSNREIAERARVSENAVKAHCSRVLEKLGARRRAQAVRKGRELGLIP